MEAWNTLQTILHVILPSLANLLYVLAGFYLGRWESEKGQATLFAAIKELKILIMHMETMRAKIHRWMREAAKEGGVELPPMPFVEWEQPIEMEKKSLEESLAEARKNARHSLLTAIIYLSAGSALFILSLIV